MVTGAAQAMPTRRLGRPKGACAQMFRAVGMLAAAASLVVQIGGAADAKTAPDPDIRGVWERFPNPVATNEDVFGDIPPPGDGPALREPYASEWKALRAKRAAAAEAGKPLVDESTKCLPEGMPLVMGAIFPIQILQDPGQVTVLAEFLTQTRRIHLDAPMPTTDDFAPSFYGFSVGHWAGDTLVVVTRHVRKDVLFFEIPHSEEMTITEHIRLVAPDRIENQIEIDDPAYLNQPYRFSFGYKRNHEYRLAEYFCDKSNDVIEKDGTVTMKVEIDSEN